MASSFLNKPAPRWYRIVKKIWSNAENLFIGIWLATGHTQDAPTLLVFKLCSSFIKDNLDTILVSESEEYVAKDDLHDLKEQAAQADIPTLRKQ